MSSKANPTAEPGRVTIYGKRVDRVEARGEKHYAVFDDGTDLAISSEAHGRIAERLRGTPAVAPRANLSKSDNASSSANVSQSVTVSKSKTTGTNRERNASLEV
jgi:hypothetical protein